jgi:hypothetical protein
MLVQTCALILDCRRRTCTSSTSTALPADSSPYTTGDTPLAQMCSPMCELETEAWPYNIPSRLFEDVPVLGEGLLGLV